MRKTLLIMAAGMGSRYGGLKQIDVVGPHGEYLIDYAVYDAIQAGFDQVVFVIRHDFAPTFKRHFAASKFQDKIKIDYAYQEMDDLPAGFKPPAERTKPWGTGHAVLAARKFIKEPFAVISADDFYGRAAYRTVADFLDQLPAASHNRYAVVGYHLGNTLSPNGWVSRGLLKSDIDGNLTSIHEHTKVGLVDGQIVSRDKNEVDHHLEPDRLVSMVLFAFTPDFFDYLQQGLVDFLRQYGDDLKMEFFTPTQVNTLIQTGQAQMKVLPTTSPWFGVTYPDDKQTTVKAIKTLIKQGEYPADLWSGGRGR